MLFMGEEYGERAPFQFFADHIDEEIAIATREGRRREFAGFAAFAGEEVPDPQDPATFERSKLTREGEPEELLELHRRLLEIRRTLPREEASDVRHDEAAGWLRVRRGPYELVANFGDEPLDIEGELVLAAGDVVVRDGTLTLAPRTGALVG
jgi:maltooligosyltrehalose trehalohydrolase